MYEKVVPGIENDFPLIWMVYWKTSWCVHTFLQISKVLSVVYALASGHLKFLDTLCLFHLLYLDGDIVPLS